MVWFVYVMVGLLFVPMIARYAVRSFVRGSPDTADLLLGLLVGVIYSAFWPVFLIKLVILPWLLKLVYRRDSLESIGDRWQAWINPGGQ